MPEWRVCQSHLHALHVMAPDARRASHHNHLWNFGFGCGRGDRQGGWSDAEADHEIDILVDDQLLRHALGIVFDRAYGPCFRERLKYRRSGGGWSFLVGIRCPSGLSK